jgi:hypothetical protein
VRILEKKEISAIILILFGLSAIISGIALTEAQPSETATTSSTFPKISITPFNLTVGSPDTLLPIPLFTIQVTITNVTDLYAWQVTLIFDDTIVNITDTPPLTAWYPQNHVFAGKTFFATSPIVGYKGKLIPPYLKEAYPVSYITFGASLQGLVPGVNVAGTATLASFNFTGIAPNTSVLHISTQPKIGNVIINSFLLDSSLQDIPFSTEDATVSVLGKPRARSSITIDFDPSTVTAGSYVAISGAITPNLANISVTLCYRLNITGKPWVQLATLKTNSSSHYTYVWRSVKNTTDAVDQFVFNATWKGDENTQGASLIKALNVNQIPSAMKIDVNPKTAVAVGSNITISGTVAPVEDDFEVEIYYRPSGSDEKWTYMATLNMNSSGSYIYIWKTTQGGAFELEARWAGSNDIKSANARTTVMVNGAFSILNYLPYILAATLLIAIPVGVLLYYKKIRTK